MSLLIESLKLKDGFLFNLETHQCRINRAMDELFPTGDRIDLSKAISIPKEYNSGIYKVRVSYGPTIEKIEFESYAFRPVKSLKVVYHDTIDYHLKYSDRQILQQLFERRGDCDDIIIVKNGLVTDSFAANLLFYDGKEWVTPSTPLLKGTKRQLLLDQRIIVEKEISEEDIWNYQNVGLINAMIDFEEMPVVSMERVF
jgi:4-amino-4-deoxychorismate lyase